MSFTSFKLKSAIITAAVLALLAPLSIAQAGDRVPGAWDHGAWGYDAKREIKQQHWRDDRRYRAPRREVLTVPLRERFRNETLPLRKLLGLGPSYAGYKIKSVQVTLKPRRNRGRLLLLVNGHPVDGSRVRGAQMIELRPGHDKVLGRELHSLKLAVQGKASIERIRVEIVRPRHRSAWSNPDHSSRKKPVRWSPTGWNFRYRFND
jgi:hypothetical protein